MTNEVREPIEGKVAQILNKRELVINRGEQDGVSVGARFAVLNSRGVSVKDPDSGEELGSIPVLKVLVQIVRVEPKLAVGRTFIRVPRRTSAFDIFGPRPSEPQFETLRTADRPYEEELDESESYVKIGDPVVEMLGNEFLSE